jgi:hypothetical protein
MMARNIRRFGVVAVLGMAMASTGWAQLGGTTPRSTKPRIDDSDTTGGKLDGKKVKRVPYIKDSDLSQGKLSKTDHDAVPYIKDADASKARLDGTDHDAVPWIKKDDASKGKLEKKRSRRVPHIKSDDASKGQLGLMGAEAVPSQPSIDSDSVTGGRLGKHDLKRVPNIDSDEPSLAKAERTKVRRVPNIDSAEPSLGKLEKKRSRRVPHIVNPRLDQGKASKDSAASDAPVSTAASSASPSIGSGSASIGKADGKIDSESTKVIGNASPGFASPHDFDRVGGDSRALIVRYTVEGGLSGADNELKIYADGWAIYRVSELGAYSLHRMRLTSLELTLLRAAFEAAEFTSMPLQFFAPLPIVDGVIMDVTYWTARGGLHQVATETGAQEDRGFTELRKMLDGMIASMTDGVPAGSAAAGR